MMFVVPATRDLTVMVVEAPVVAISVALVFSIVLAFLSKRSAASEG
jgi:membrane protein CcdC involved in cytochrome C biogenesis